MRRVGALLGAVGLFAGVVPTPASATWDELNGFRFWTDSVCMAVGDAWIEAPYVAQTWNETAGVRISARNNCVTAGYPPSRRFTIDTFYDGGLNAPCWKVTDRNGERVDPGADAVARGGFWAYTDNPMTLVNRACLEGGTVYRRHATGGAIGAIMGLRTWYSSGYRARIMCDASGFECNVSYPDVYSARLMRDVYDGRYGG